MKVIGLTGSIGMGKSTAAAMLQEMGIPVHSADTAVHELLAPGGAAVAAVAAAFPDAAEGSSISRTRLGQLVFADEAKLKQLEAILHPLVKAHSQQWLQQQRAALVVLDIPLLYEAGRDKDCDAVWVVSAPAEVQRARVLARPGMTPARLEQILARQISDSEKRRRADVVIPTGEGLEPTRTALTAALKQALTG